MLTNSSRTAYGLWPGTVKAYVGGIIAVTAFVITTLAGAQTKPAIVVSQTNWLNVLQGVGGESSSGGALASQNLAGTSFAVNSNGDILMDNTYGNQVLLFNGQTGSVTVLGTGLSAAWGVGAVTVDSRNNLYIAGLNQPYIAKIPYDSATGTYAAISTPTSSTPACSGTDTAECLWGSNLLYSGNGSYFGVVSMTFDAAGDFYFATDAAGPTYSFSIFECNAACVATADGGTGGSAPVKIYTEPVATPSTVTLNAQGLDCATNSSMVQITVGGLAADPWGNVFFTDSALDSCGNSGGEVNQSDFSNVKEMAYSGTGYGTPVTLYTYLPQSSVGSYDDEVDGVAVDGSGTVYFTTQYDGLFAFANNGTPFTGVLSTAEIYGVSTQGSEAVALDAKGNAYIAAQLPPAGSGSSSITTLGRVSINSVPFPASPVGVAVSPTPSSALTSMVKATDSTVVMVNDGDCTSSPAVSLIGNLPDFAVATTGACLPAPYLFPGEASFAATVSFTPKAVGERSALLTGTDTVNGGSGTAIAFGVGEGAMVTLDPGGTTTTYSGFTTPTGISVDAKGNLFVADAGASKVDEIATGGMTLTSVGSGFSGPTGTAVDAAGNLYISDTGNNQIVEIANLSGTASQSVPVTSATTFGGTALKGPTGLAMGADGVLYITDTGNNRVVMYSTMNGVGGVRVTGLSNPGGIAVDAAGSLYVANLGTGGSGAGVMVYSSGAAETTLSLSGVTAPVGVAVEPSGSVLISDGATGNIVRVPNEAGKLNAADAVVIENNPKSGGGLALGSSGNLYTTDATGATAYAIQRTSSTIDFGNIDAGSSSPAVAIYAESAGNMDMAPASGATLFLTAPSSAMFTLAAGSPADCTTATSVASGTACEFMAQFSPPSGTATGAVSATAYFDSTALNQPKAPITLNGAAVALAAAAMPTFTPAGGTYSSAQSVTIADATAGASIYYTTDGSTPTASSTLYSGAITVSSTETINAIAVVSGYADSAVASATYTITATPAGFTITLDSSALTVKAGANASAMVSVTPQGGFSSQVTFSCSGLPSGATCAFSPATVTPSGGSAVTAQLKVSASSTMAGLRKDSNPLLPGAALACVLCCCFGIRKKRRLMMLLVVVSAIGVGAATGCGMNLHPLSTSSVVTVNAASGGMHSSATFKLTVQP